MEAISSDTHQLQLLIDLVVSMELIKQVAF